MKSLLITVCVFLTSFGSTVKLPSEFIKCDLKQNDFQECLTTAVQKAIRELNRPFRKVNLLGMEPLEIPELTIAAGSRIVFTQQIFKHLKLSGFNETTCSKVEFDVDTKTLKLDCVVPHFRLDFEYELHGQVFLISVYGKGTGWAILQDNHLVLSFNFGEYEKKGKKYYNVIKEELYMQPRKIDFDLKNLFDGDEKAADRFLKIARTNILEMYDDVRSGYQEAFGKIFGFILDGLLTKVPVADLFGKK
ncbi:hypothetical protein Zmor_017294 [Zophobas morio]|uniref:Uncharacterized protein n=1 Tax=Zophobas morio TaxID=2755281 RepID=A0AA38I8R1_9CUCU|nr:hypothetical protein Zmor_017294 [Zophobas morio]